MEQPRGWCRENPLFWSFKAKFIKPMFSKLSNLRYDLAKLLLIPYF